MHQDHKDAIKLLLFHACFAVANAQGKIASVNGGMDNLNSQEQSWWDQLNEYRTGIKRLIKEMDGGAYNEG